MLTLPNLRVISTRNVPTRDKLFQRVVGDTRCTFGTPWTMIETYSLVLPGSLFCPDSPPGSAQPFSRSQLELAVGRLKWSSQVCPGTSVCSPGKFWKQHVNRDCRSNVNIKLDLELTSIVLESPPEKAQCKSRIARQGSQFS